MSKINIFINKQLSGVSVYFEKENINTLLGDGELMLTILSAFEQEESRSVSEHMIWSIRKIFERGELFFNTKLFLRYDIKTWGD